VRGPYKTAEHLGVDTSVLFASSSPIEGYILSRFSALESLPPEDMLYGLLKDIGQSLIQLIDLKQQRLKRLKAEAKVVPVKHLKALVCNIAENPKLALEIFLRELNDEKIAICITPSIRGDGWELLRLGDHSVVDFRTIGDDPEIRFVHITGFIAKTATLLPLDQVIRLVTRAIKTE